MLKIYLVSATHGTSLLLCTVNKQFSDELSVHDYISNHRTPLRLKNIHPTKISFSGIWEIVS